MLSSGEQLIINLVPNEGEMLYDDLYLSVRDARDGDPTLLRGMVKNGTLKQRLEKTRADGKWVFKLFISRGGNNANI